MYIEQLIKTGINLRGKKSGQIKTFCPKCSNGKKEYDLSVNIDEGVYNCHKLKCGWSGTVKTFKKKEAMEYTKPKWKNVTALSDSVIKWMNSRGVGQQTLIELKITEGLEWMPQTQKEENTIQFNYFRKGELLNTKFRDAKKNFKLIPKAELLFYNEDAIRGNKEIIITEGEIDCLSFVEAGIKNTISVPNGANGASLKLDYLEACADDFEKIEKVYIATDNDTPGVSLRNELARRIGIDKCFIIDFEDCKDANEYMLKYGKTSLSNLISSAKDFPIEGIINIYDISKDIDNIYFEGMKRGATTGFYNFDELISFERGYMTLITGIPNHGKSEFLDMILIMLTIKHGWKFAIFSPENHPIALHVAKLMEKIIGKQFWGQNRISEQEKEIAKEFMNKHFFFIKPLDENYSLDSILSKAKSLVMRKGIDALIIDPFNRIEHHIPSGVTETNYISKILDHLKSFQEKNGIHTFLVAHPKKINKNKTTEQFEVPNLYDVSGSSNFFNKPDSGIVVYRNFLDGQTYVYVQKVRYKHWGKQGVTSFSWNKNNGRYSEGAMEDNSNYLLKQEEKEIPFSLPYKN